MDEIEKKARELLAAEFDAADLLGARDRIADNQPLTPVEKAALRAIAAALRSAQVPEGVVLVPREMNQPAGGEPLTWLFRASPKDRWQSAGSQSEAMASAHLYGSASEWLPVYTASPAAQVQQEAGITAEWVIGYFPSDVAEEMKRAVRDAFGEYAALATHPAADALGAEVADARDGWHMANGAAELAMRHRDAAEARAERLAEAGRRVTAAFRAHGETTPFTREAERTRHECEAAMLALDAALEQEEGRG